MIVLIKSKAFWSAVVFVLGIILQNIGKPLDEMQQAQLTESLMTIAGIVCTILGGAGTVRYQNFIKIPKVKK
jgi:hypothetical protein